MNNKVYVAEISWIKKDDGGRTGPIPFKVEKYAPILSIHGEKVFSGSHWSILCYPYEKINDFKTKAYIRFLISKNAPDILAVGLHFELFEGSKKVAYGLILQESDYLFDFHEEVNK